VPVISGVTCTVGAGEVVGLVGANGAGKSTLLATLAGLLRPWRGAIRLDGARVEGFSPQRLVRAGVSLVPQGRRVFPGLSVRANLELGGWTRPRRGLTRRVEHFLERHPGLAERSEVPAGSLSGGEQGLVVLGRALMASPRVLLLDEPLMGLDPRSAATVLDDVRRLAADGSAVVIVDHDRAALETVATSILLVDGGRVAPLHR
jgi:branched-chain amino acid transport system ATP-binding protein